MKEKKLTEQIKEKVENIEMLKDELGQLRNITRDGKERVYEWSGGEFSILWTEGDDLEEAGIEIEVEEDGDIEDMLDDIAYDLGGVLKEDLVEQIEESIEEKKQEFVDLWSEKLNEEFELDDYDALYEKAMNLRKEN